MNRTGDMAMAALRADWLTGGGEMGKLIRVMDWSRTPVGPIESWPQSLKTAVYILLNSRYPMFIWWGRELTNIYNDAYMPMLGARHPQALGRSAAQVWADVWPVVGPQAEVVMREGRGTRNESILLVMERHGYTEETYFTFSYSPAPDDAGGVGGVLCAVTEDTARALGARRLKTLRDLGERSLAEAKTAEQACRAAAVTLADNLRDFPFALIYLLDEDGKRARLCETVNLPAETKASPAAVTIGAGDDVWKFSRVIETSQNQIVEDLEERFGRLPAGPWTDDWTKRAMALSLARAGAQEFPAGFLVAGISPRLEFNDDYRSFLDLAAGQIANAISNTRAYEEERKSAEALAESARQQRALYQLADHLHRAQSLDDVYNAALDAILGALRCDRASILLFDDAGVMRFAGWRDLSEGYRKAVEGHSPWKPDEKYPEPVCLNDIDVAEIDDSLRAVVKAEGIGAVAFIPLVSRGKLIGKFMTYFNAPHVMSDDEIALSLTIARQLAFGIDRKRAEELLRQKAAQLTLITNTAPVFIAHCDAQARFKFVNKPYAERFGLTPEDCIGKLFSEVVGAEAYESLRQYIEVALSGEPVEFELEVPNGAIGRRFMHSSYAPEFDANGKVVGFVAAITDVSESKKADQKLIAAIAKFESVFNQSGIYAGMLDLQGYMREVNDMAVNRCGYAREQALDRPFWETPWWRGSEGVKGRIRDATEQAAAGMIFREELPYWWADGTEHVMDFALLPIRDQDGGVMLLYQTGIDITERKRAEEEIVRLLAEEQEAREMAEQATRAKDEFLAVVSHELRSPLNAILGWNRLLRSQRGDDPQIAKVAETVELSGKAQLQLIEDLLDTARIISGKLRLELGPADPVLVIEQAVQTIHPAADAKEIRLETNLPSEIGQITGDPARLQQVVWNLLSNAVKFTPQGGRVEVSLERIDPHICITVSDTGKGISPDFLPYVFDRFRQADASSAKRYGGLGLGLALVKYLVELHGGTIEAASAGEGLGATFKVTLPVRAVKGDSMTVRQREEEAAVDRRAGRRTPTARLEGVRALVVDDEPDARELLAATLEQYGVLVTGADSTAAALAALESQIGDVASEPFDILISDIGMPDADGYELMRLVRAHADGRVSHIRAIALTAYARTEDRLMALQAGFQMHVPKPVEAEELTMVIAALTDRL